MQISSVLSSAGLALRQNVIYRARMLIKAPGVVATEGKVASALADQGFADVQFFERDKLPGDWPIEEHEDPSGFLSWTAFLQGRFTMTDRTIALSELPGTVSVLAMWQYLVPLVQQAALGPVPVPDVSTQPVLSFPVTTQGAPPDLSPSSKLLGVAVGAATGLLLLRMLRGRRSERR